MLASSRSISAEPCRTGRPVGTGSPVANGALPFRALQKNEWLCLNCQTQRLLEGSLADPAPVPMPAPKQPASGSPRHQPPAAVPRAPAPPEPAAPPDRQPSPARSLRAPEQSPAPSPAPEKKPPAPAEEKPLPKAAPEPSPAPKGKSVSTKPEGESKVGRVLPEAQRTKEQEVSALPCPCAVSSPRSLCARAGQSPLSAPLVPTQVL